MRREDGRNTSSAPAVTNCTLLDSLPLEDPKVIGSLVPLGLICLIVTFGNILVISAVRISSKLRGPTNTIIVSLAVADLLLGLLVLPLSAVYEVTDRWLFGRHLCFIWLSVDVWTCTASILHLVAISMDRYIAVTHPVTYPNIMTSKRTKVLIGSVWAISFVICFPPLVGWSATRRVQNISLVSNTTEEEETAFNITEYLEYQEEESMSGYVDSGLCNPQCRVNSDPAYVLFSAIGTFFAPMFVMIFFNWRIYRVASKTTKAIRRGFTQVKANGRAMGGMGIHRGRTSTSITNTTSPRERLIRSDKDRSLQQEEDCMQEMERECSSTILEPSSSSRGLGVARHSVTSHAYNGTTSNTSTTNGHIVRSGYSCTHHGHRRYFTEQGTQTVRTFRSKTGSRKQAGRKNSFTGEVGSGSFKGRRTGSEGKVRRLYSRIRRRRRSTFGSKPPSPTLSLCEDTPIHNTETTTSFTKRNIKTQVRKFRMETKAAKTIGIIVGCFVLCWLPFFTIYVIRAACVDCIPELLFSVFFWLGYCNSAINPVIYGLFSREFRCAFKKILCKFFCRVK